MDEYVTILVLTYNSSATIIETLESIKSQTYHFLDLVINDDASEDDTVTRIEEWMVGNSGGFRTIRVNVSQVNQGISKSLNVGMSLCKTTWVKLVAGDDIMLSNCIFNNLEYVHNHNVNSIVFSYYAMFMDVDGCRKYKKMSNYTLDYINRLDRKSVQGQFRELLNEDVLVSPSQFIHRGMFNKIGGANEEIRNIEDWPLRLKITSSGYRLYFLPKYTGLYRVGNNSASRDDKKLYNVRHIDQYQLCKRKCVYPNQTYDLLYWIGELVEILKYYIVIIIFRNDKGKVNRIINFLFSQLDFRHWRRNLFSFFQLISHKESAWDSRLIVEDDYNSLM